MSGKLNIQDPVVRKILIGGKEKGILTFGIQSKGEVSVTSDSMHHIHILDRSGSMGWTIHDLMEDVKKTLRIIDRSDYVTIIWFSGAGQYRTVVKCAKNDPTSIDKILDSLKSTVGCTCFSDPIKELDEIIRETAPMCDVFNVTIFTDGDTVTPWSVAEETKRIFENLDVVKNKIVAFNTVGYGNYYNRDLLLKMSKTTEYGQLTHASKIDEYSKIFSHNRDMVADLVGKRITVMSPNSEIVTLSARSTKLGEEKAVVRLGKTTNEFCIIFDANRDRISYTVNDEAFSMSFEDVGVCTLDEYEDMDLSIILAYAYNLYYEGRRKDALNVLNALGDTDLMDKQFNSFTTQEVGEYVEYLRNALFSKKVSKTRSGFFTATPNSYMPDPNAYCILDLLRDLVDVDAKYLPTDNYQRVGRKVVDEFDCFERDENQEAVDMSGIVLSQDRLNISLRFEIKGKVRLNPKRAKSVGLPEVVDGCKIYRTHTIVQDGGLNINRLRVIVNKSKDAYDKFLVNALGIILEESLTTATLEIDLTKLPVINQSYLADTTAESLLKLERQMLEIEAQNKVLKTLIKDDISEYKGTGYTAEQVMVLQEHGLNAQMAYSSLAPKTQEAEDYNVVKEFRTCLKGFSSLPSINQVEKKLKDNKKLTNPEALLNKYMTWAGNTMGCANFKSILKNNKKVLNELRFNLSGAKLALVLTGEWLPELELQEDGSYIYSDGNDTLVVKLERKEIPV